MWYNIFYLIKDRLINAQNKYDYIMAFMRQISAEKEYLLF